MPKRSRRRGGKKSRRTTWIALALLVIIAVSGIGVYFVYSIKPSPTSTNTSTVPAVGPYAVFVTTQGQFVVQLYPKDAPITVANFEKLVNKSFYTDLVWHRIVAGFVIQSGDPTTKNGGGTKSAWGETGSGTTIPFENTGLPEGQGYVAMANTAAGGNGASSQFFINLVNNTSTLPSGYAVFGQVISGFSVVQAIGALPVNANCQSSQDTTCQPLTPTDALIDSITIQDSP